jgi:hypothetical protein
LSLLLPALLATALSCARVPEDPATRLIRQLPPGQAIYLYLDIARLRDSPSLEPVLQSAVWTDGVRDIANAAGLDLADFAAAAVSLGPKGAQLAVEGRFDEAAMRQALESAGADCPESMRSSPCRLAASGPRPELSLSVRAQDLLRVSFGSDLEAAPVLRETGLQKLAVQVRERLKHGALLWATFEPGRAEQALSSEALTNLRFLARALQRADRGYFYVDELPEGELRVTLKARCADSREADSVSKVLTGLNRLAAAALEAGKGEEPPPEARVLRRASIVNTQTDVTAIWVVDEPTLRAWKGVG